jgi:hypothetical protein
LLCCCVLSYLDGGAARAGPTSSSNGCRRWSGTYRPAHSYAVLETGRVWSLNRCMVRIGPGRPVSSHARWVVKLSYAAAPPSLIGTTLPALIRFAALPRLS